MTFPISPRLLFSGLLTTLAFIAGLELGQAREPMITVMPLFSTSTTVMDEPVTYPCGAPAKLTAALISMQPGGQTGWHTHGVPLAGFVLEGELTVDYGGRGQRTYKAGDGLAEAMAVPHNGANLGSSPVRLLAVYLGADGVANTVPTAGPQDQPRP